jgi:hypothetical protein
MVTDRIVGVRHADATANPGKDLTADASLVRRVVGGSEEALAALYDRHASAVFAAALRTSGDRWVAAEVVQETFLALWNCRAVRPEPRSPVGVAVTDRPKSCDRSCQCCSPPGACGELFVIRSR